MEDWLKFCGFTASQKFPAQVFIIKKYKMENKSNAIQVFHQYAEDKLKDHFEELKTRYENEKLASDELKQQAFDEHQKLYSKELDEKMQSLSHEDKELKHEMENLKETYVTKLSLNKPRQIFHHTK